MREKKRHRNKKVEQREGEWSNKKKQVENEIKKKDKQRRKIVQGSYSACQKQNGEETDSSASADEPVLDDGSDELLKE